MLGPDQTQPNCNSAQWGNGILMTLELPLAGPTPMPHAPPPSAALRIPSGCDPLLPN